MSSSDRVLGEPIFPMPASSGSILEALIQHPNLHNNRSQHTLFTGSSDDKLAAPLSSPQESPMYQPTFGSQPHLQSQRVWS
jgi:hypothetical protein